jgi:hypothetical protein
MKINEALAEAFGIHAGDGYLRTRERNKGEIDISGNIEEKGYYDNHVVPLFNKIFNLNMIGRFFSRGTYGFVNYQKEVRDVFLEAGFPSGKKSQIVKTPDCILNREDKKLYARFLRGYFDTDGCLYFKSRRSEKCCDFKKKFNYYPILSMSSTSKKLIENVGFMLDKLGIVFFYYGYQPKNKRDNYKHMITISGPERLEKWMKIIGTKNRVKLTRYLVWEKFGFCPPHTTLKQREDFLNDKLDIYSLYST